MILPIWKISNYTWGISLGKFYWGKDDLIVDSEGKAIFL